MNGRSVTCTVNPETGKEGTFYAQAFTAKEPRRVAVVGGGPAGIHAAMTASERGHDVTLFEKNDTLGGMLNYLTIPDFKVDYRDYLKYLLDALSDSEVKVVTGVDVTADLIRENRYDKVIIATGAMPHIPPIKGLDRALEPLAILKGNYPKGENIVICGAGLVGTEIAMVLAEEGKRITIVDILSEVNSDLMEDDRRVIRGKLAELGVCVKMNHAIQEITSTAVVCIHEGKKVSFPADSVVCALGMKPQDELATKLRQNCPAMEIVMAGDVNAARKVLHAVHEGFHAGRRI
jgi:NADPH-dependent 2,4-dienoyl-CoA reductase/sulfur reductase-like enzyme